MNTNILAIIILICIALTGLINISVGLYRLDEKHRLLIEFTNRFIKIANTYFVDMSFSDSDYDWLLENVDEVNNILGSAGTISYKPAYANYIHSNYQMLINTLPHFKTRHGVEPDDATFVESLLKRFAGVLKKAIKVQVGDIKNPIKWFSEGISFILSLPLSLMKSIGILNLTSYSKAINSGLFKAAKAIISIVSFIDVVYTIIAGNSFTINFIKSIF